LQAAGATGFRVEGAELVISGVCAGCATRADAA
jgi:Fe2+ or Zn2+ uptake regulation protein